MIAHYEGEIEPIEYMAGSFTDDEYRGFLKGNIIKYISRAGKKGDALDDLNKAKQYLDWLIEEHAEDSSDIPCKSLAQVLEEAEAEIARKKKQAKQVLDASADERQMEWIRLRDARGWT